MGKLSYRPLCFSLTFRDVREDVFDHRVVRMTHLATGLSVTCDQYPDSYRNRRAAFNELQRRYSLLRRGESSDIIATP